MFYLCLIVLKVAFAQFDSDNFTQAFIRDLNNNESAFGGENTTLFVSTTDKTTLNDEDFAFLTSTASSNKEIGNSDSGNENWPIFQNLPYIFTVNETAVVGSELYRDILVTSDSSGKIVLKCDNETTPEACTKFSIKSDNLTDGDYRGIIELQETLDFETTSTYILAIKAENIDRHVVSAIVVIEVLDEQDLGPQFGSESYFVDLQEELIDEKIVLTVDVNDADKGNPRPLIIAIQNDFHGFFKINNVTNDSIGNYLVDISSAGKRIDRESREITWNGGYYIFQIRATELENGVPNDVSTAAEIWVNVLDVNDNSPMFDKSNLALDLAENLTVGVPIPLNLRVTDADSEENAQFGLFIGAEGDGFDDLFEIEPQSAQNSALVALKLKKDAKLDYEDERQRKMNFVITAIDGSGNSNSTNLTIFLIDSNDNSPIFDQSEYKIRIDNENSTNSLITTLNATDADSGEFGDVTYEIVWQKFDQYRITPKNGSIFTTQCDICSFETNYLIVKAKDGGGKFALALLTIFTVSQSPNDTKTNDKIGKIQFENSFYNTTIREITKEGTVVARLLATSSEPDTKIDYSILNGAEGNFDIDSTEGILRVAPGASLDIDRTKIKDYNITVGASRTGSDASDVAHAYITIEDVNNKPPKFENRFYIVRIDAEKNVGDEIFRVEASDPDFGAELKYSLGKSLVLHDKDGNVSADSVAINEVLRINSTSGNIDLIRSLSDYFMAMLKVTVEDLAAQTPGQSDTAEIIIFVIGSEDDLSWELPKSDIELNLSEEIDIGNRILVLGGSAVTKRDDLIFQKIDNSDIDNYFDINPISGVLTIVKRIDYEALPESNKSLNVSIRATLGGKMIGNVTVILNIIDINDNRPIFEQSNYSVSILESIEDEIVFLNLTAIDNDSGGFGQISYRLAEDNDFFSVDDRGILTKKSGVVIDREIVSFHSIRIVATDNPTDPTDQRTGQTTVQITVDDANDNPPKFERNSYKVIIPENLASNSPFFQLRATDADIGPNSVIEYSINIEEKLFGIDTREGLIYTNSSLSATDRSFPYHLRVTATDSGIPPLSTTCDVEIHLGDLSVVDELSKFIFPQKGDVIHVVESDKEDLTVCQVELSKPDRFKNMKSVIRFSLLDFGYGGSDRRYFTINTDTGLITTRRPLDRETRENYTLVVAATQVGSSMSQAYQIVHVSVTDVDDNLPYFPRPVNSNPLQMSVLEESVPGTTVGTVEAIDKDSGENAILLYTILGDDDGSRLFGINNTMDGKSVIYVKDRLDHEKRNFYDLVIRVQNPSDDKWTEQLDNSSYEPRDLSKVRVRVNLIDIDDNEIQFVSPTENLGVRLNAPRQSIVTTIQAFDPDPSDNPLQYFIERVTFRKNGEIERTVYEEMFFLEKDSGILRTAQSLSNYEDGEFDLVISARTAKKTTTLKETKFKIKVLHDSNMLKFVFQKPPIEVQRELSKINRDFQNVVDLPQPVTLQLADTQLDVRRESYINSDTTNVCFQMIKDKLPIRLTEAQTMLDSSGKPALEKFYRNYNISHIGSCDQIRSNHRINWLEMLVLVIASLIAISVTFSLIFISLMTKTKSR